MNIQTALKKYAEQDLRIARAKGAMSICNTRHGKLLEIRYDRDYGRQAYSILVDWKTKLLYVGKAEALAFVMSAYDVVADAN
jgi:hypothetical protein